MCPRERFSLYKSLSRLVLCYKKDWATLLHFIYFCYLLLVTIYLITKLSVTTYFSTCREYLAENRLSFPSAPRWVRHSYLSKGLRLIPYTCGSSDGDMLEYVVMDAMGPLPQEIVENELDMEEATVIDER